ncbi:hypothetical protein CEUSTIGMA_g13188.t1 [Chlamydomonas eustigma]|uniref:Cilia- and flagella-associated protein 36 n=1 Tax=Chlamydomonas eustigma TaxID=1157962 RepID=A0A250XRY0_9CHLO|nr:hypothetical protein CEUSTIGMA_g13188.t1 [Chlamydomonas eustigma]|eukprot:GAX85773.1 hypothetical protein CEUSTIGMA_g13188.t1 [Chlamydomonas eustigma]
MADTQWLAEAVVDFLRGPLYINPLMAFIDQKCLIFTPEEENKLEYTPIHEQFKELVDELLTEFITDLGVTPEQFYEVVASEHSNESLNSFVVQTILTVDDFLLFKAMMVKRNIDLTNQVLAAVRDAALGTATGDSNLSEEEEARMLEEALMKSKLVNADEEHNYKLFELMKSLQIEEEDPAMVLALANSLKDQTRMEYELAEIQQALALSIALEEERQRLLLQEGSVQGAAMSTSSQGAAVNSRVSTTAFISDADNAAVRAAGIGDIPLRAPTFITPTQVDPLAPLNIGPNTAAEQMAAVAAAAEANARALAAAVVTGTQPPVSAGAANTGSAMKGAGLSTRLEAGSFSVVDSDASGAAGLGRLPPLQPGQRNMGGLAPLPSVNSPRKPSEDLPSGNLILGGARSLKTVGSVRNKAAGYKADAVPDLATIREAAEVAASTQKGMLETHISGAGGSDDAAQKWLQDQKLKLVAQKKVERDAETAQFKLGKSFTAGHSKPAFGSSTASVSDQDMEAKRAALRDKLAQKFKGDMMKQAFE